MQARKAVLATAFAVALGLGAAGAAFGHDQHGQGGPSYGQGMPGYGMGPGMMGPGMMELGYGRGPGYGTCPYGMGSGMMNGYGGGWMGGYGAIWVTVLLVIVAAGLVAWVVKQKRK